MDTPPVLTQREPSVVMLRMCPTCREYARQGSTDRCIDCGTVLPERAQSGAYRAMTGR